MTDTQHPEGWKLVPVEPTEEMVELAIHADRPSFDRGAIEREIWRLMVSASPAPQRETGDFRSACGADSPRVDAEPHSSAPSGNSDLQQFRAATRLHARIAALEGALRFYASNSRAWMGRDGSLEPTLFLLEDQGQRALAALTPEQTGGDPSAATTPANPQDEPKTTPPTTSGKGA